MRLCIVGGGSTRMQAPFNDPNAVIWSTFSVGQELPRVDACFEIHDGIYPPEQLNAAGCDIYLKEFDIAVKKAKRFPIERLVDQFGKRFNGTVVMILAYAYLEGYRDIWLYGCDFSSEAEINRRVMFAYMIGRLEELGCTIHIPDGGLFVVECKTYAYEPDAKDYFRYIRNRLNGQIADDEKNMLTLYERRGYARGVKETLDAIERRY